MSRSAYSGPALFSLGFRPFFLAATFFGLGVVPAWWLVWAGRIEIGGPFHAIDWHVHEMVFGYAGAVIAGFLFTAVPNWTRRMPKQGWPLVGLALLWAAGRVVVALPGPLPPVAVAAIDCGFLLAIAAITAVEIVAGRNWRNLMVVGPATVLAAANLAFHVEAAMTGDAALSRRLGIAVIVFLVTLIGGRIIPSFTRNWLVQRGATRFPVPFGRPDAAIVIGGGAALIAWVGWPDSGVTAILLAAAALGHLFRLSRWRGAASWRAPLLAMLHVAFVFVPAGLLATAAAAAGWIAPAVGFHLLGIGGIGGMTVAVMIRATRGHTGRNLVAGPALALAFGLIVLAALARVAPAGWSIGGIDGIAAAALAWTAGFAILALRMAPWLAGPAQGAKPVSGRRA